MRAMIAQHHNAVQKTGAGIKEIRVVSSPKNRANAQFQIVYVDGSPDDDVSFEAVLSPPSAVHYAKSGLRAAIQPQLQSYRRRFLQGNLLPRSELSGEPLVHGEIHVDHVSPFFDEIVHGFINARQLPWDEVATEPDPRGGRRLLDHALKEEWSEFHLHHAVLRAISTTENLTRSKPLRSILRQDLWLPATTRTSG